MNSLTEIREIKIQNSDIDNNQYKIIEQNILVVTYGNLKMKYVLNKQN